MHASRLLPLALAALVLAGCGRALPGAAVRTPRAMAAREAEAPRPAASFRLDLAEEGYQRLRGAFAWQPAADQRVYAFAGWDGRAFAAVGARLTLRTDAEGATWRIEGAAEPRTVGRSGLPVAMTVTRRGEGALPIAAAAHLVSRVDDFFGDLDAGGERLRSDAAAVDAGWRGLAGWAGADVFFPAGAEAPQLVPCGVVRRHRQVVAVPRESVGGGLALTLAFDEAFDGEGRWVDGFAVEAEPLEALAAGDEEPTAVDFGRALAVVGLVPEETAPAVAGAAAYVARQLAR